MKDRRGSYLLPGEVGCTNDQTLAEPRRKRGKGETVAITVRLTRSQWERLHQFAVSEGDSLQGLALRDSRCSCGRKDWVNCDAQTP